MASITRDRGCLYYVPWISTFCVCLAISSLGVWAFYTRKCRNFTIDGLENLGIAVKYLDRINSALIATAITYLVVAIVIFLMSLWRSFIEAAHDAVGLVARGAMAFLILNFSFTTLWWAIILWMVLLIMGNTLWGTSLYLVIGAIKNAQANLKLHGTATWLPSRNLPCPGQCLDLTVFSFVTSQLKDACICDTSKLQTAKDSFDQAYDFFMAVAIGNWVVLVTGICLLMNFACQFSHTKRELESLSRVANKVYSSVQAGDR